MKEYGCPYGSYSPESTCNCVFCERNRLKALVREMAEIVQAVARNKCCRFGSIGSGVMLHGQGPRARAIIDRLEVNAILEEEDITCGYSR